MPMRSCWFYRKLASFEAETAPRLSAPLQRHLRTCNACRGEYQRQVELAARLTATVAAEWRSAPPFLASRVMHALAAGAPTARGPAWQRHPAWAATAALTGAALLLALMLMPHAPKPAPGTLNVPALVAELWPDRQLVPTGRRLLELSQTLDRSLEAEVQFVVSDAQGAARSLAQSFLP